MAFTQHTQSPLLTCTIVSNPRLVRLTPMYWPLGHVHHVSAERPSGGNDTLLDFCYNRRTNLFLTYSEQSITLWSSEVSSEVGESRRC
jgi:hypothetical protein